MMFMPNQAPQLKAMISSTARDLPEHRRMIMDACLRLGIQPIMMEHLAGQDRSALDVSIGMVEDADVYIGVFAFAYGSSPAGDTRSYSEIEFDKAVALKIPIVPLFADEDVPWPPRSVDKNEKAAKLEQLKKKAAENRIIQRFKSPEDLRGLVIHALTEIKKTRASSTENWSPSFHPPSNIPQAPSSYIAHPYVLLQTKEVIGRRDELKLLTDWITKNEQVPKDTRILSMIAMGGMGKSALTWKWFEDIAPNELPNLAGRMWWSFYETDAHWGNFIIRALAYASGMSELEVRQLSSSEREASLLRLLDEQPFLFVLDGLERILIAYVQADASDRSDYAADALSKNSSLCSTRLCDEKHDSRLNSHHLRQCADASAGAFLRKLTRVRASRLLLSTRLNPEELETQSALPLPGYHAHYLAGLTDDDALSLWRGFIGGERSGTSEELLPLFKAFGNYPLLIRALAGEVARFRPSPGDFSCWRQHHPDFNPARLPLNNARTHVLEYALRGLGTTQCRVLQTIAAFRMPATWDTLCALLIHSEKDVRGNCAALPDDNLREPVAHERFWVVSTEDELVSALTELEDRGLLGWDRIANRYDLHPIVREVVWASVGKGLRKVIHQARYDFFGQIPHKQWSEVSRLDDLFPVIELFNSLVSIGRSIKAIELFGRHISHPLCADLSAYRLAKELLSKVGFQNAGEPDYPLANEELDTWLKWNFECAYSLGELEEAQEWAEARVALHRHTGSWFYLMESLVPESRVLLQTGALNNAVHDLLEAIALPSELDRMATTKALTRLARVNVILGRPDVARTALNRILQMRAFVGVSGTVDLEGHETFAELLLSEGDNQSALAESEKLTEYATMFHVTSLVIASKRLSGIAHHRMGNLDCGFDLVSAGLQESLVANLIEEELRALTVLADFQRQRKNYDAARDLLQRVWALAGRGPYPLWHADGRNVLAQIERDLGNTAEAIEAATTAYRFAWCDGPPYAYHHGLTNARKLLQELDAREPQLPPFDESKFPPLPDVELNPNDEFGSASVPQRITSNGSSSSSLR
jgi:Domain of unknown function (DUF4062)